MSTTGIAEICVVILFALVVIIYLITELTEASKAKEQMHKLIAENYSLQNENEALKAVVKFYHEQMTTAEKENEDNA